MDTDALLSKSYGDRQFIVFVDDPESAKENRELWKNIADGLEEVEKMYNAIFPLANLPAVVMWPHIGLPGYLSKKAAERIREAQNLNVPLLPVPSSATSELKLPPGHPRGDLLYVAHPANPQAYLPFASFHRLVFESKFAEVMSLLAHLGAASIHVKHVRGWEKDLSVDVSAEVPEGNVETSSEIEGSSDTSRELLYNAELSGHDKPSLHEEPVWYPHEPTWQSIARSRMEFDLLEFDFELTYTDDFEVTADLAADVEKAGFSLGGSFESHQETVWEIESSFGS